MSLNNLANSLQARFQQRGALSDLDEAIELHQAALMLHLPGHSDRSMSLNNIAISLQARFQQWGVLSDLDEAIDLHRAALVLYRFKQRGASLDLQEVFSLYLPLSQISHPATREDLRATKSWAASSEQLNHHSSLLAYQTTLKFLDQYIAVLSSCSRHFNMVREATSSIAMDAFSFSWAQLARFHTPLDELSASSDASSALAEEFRQLSVDLRKALDAIDVSPEDQSLQIRRLTVQWDAVLSHIRVLPDFSSFLLPPLVSDLWKATEDGPVIIINASQYSCDALIIMSDQDPVHISLDITRAAVSEMSSVFQSFTVHAGSSDHEMESNNIVGVLRELWGRVVGPILQVLRKFIPCCSCIWWCPTTEFTLLPLHAAGPYELKSHNFSHFYISSYTPTLTTLIRARQQASRDASAQHFVAIGQVCLDGGKELQCVADELDVVAQRVAPFLPFMALAGSDATVQGAFDAISQKQWLHLACHGMPNRQQLLESSFAMHDGPLKIRDIIRTHLHDPEFAFLSACHTTVGNESSPDEAIHLAAAIQFSGFRSVIGSMWSVDDNVAGQVASLFYANLVDDSGRLDCKYAVESLHKAVKTLCKEIPFEQQIVFVHIGV
ncbi:CHAT domain-containing protein [Suillus ampliporus]|nr:CHAT domain-containing protein [Suillus ampliporus]